MEIIPSPSIIPAVIGFSPLSTRPRYGRETPSNFASLLTSRQGQKLSQLLKPPLVYRRDGLGFMAQLLHRPNQLEQRFVRYWHAFAQIPQGVGGHPSPAKQNPIGDLA